MPDDRLQPEFLEPIANPGSRGFRREAVTSMSLAEPPSDLHRREDFGIERRDGQARPACEVASFGDDEPRYRNARISVVLDRAFEKCLVSLLVRPRPDGYRQNDSSAWSAARSSRSSITSGRSTSRSVVNVGQSMQAA